jgi:hypothetical protein
MKPKPKQKSEHPASFGKGGPGHMFSPQSAGKAAAGITGKAQRAAPGAKAASGGAKTRGVSSSVPAKPGKTGPDNLRKSR